MSCVAGEPTFRLLDRLVGWEESPGGSIVNLEDLESADGLRLASLAPGAGEPVPPELVDPYLPPAWLATGCGPCELYLVTPSPPPPRLLRLEPCTACEEPFHPVWIGDQPPAGMLSATAVATFRHWIAISDPQTDTVWIFSRRRERLAATVSVPQPGPLAFTPSGELLVVSGGTLRRFDATGFPLAGPLPALPAEPAVRLAVSPGDCESGSRLWLATTSALGLHLWQGTLDAAELTPASLDELAAALPRTRIHRAGKLGLCIEVPRDGDVEVCCYDRFGRPRPPLPPPPAPPLAYARRGQLLTGVLDSGLPRCRWHRVRIQADVPPGTTVEVAVSASAEEAPAPQGAIAPELQPGQPWHGFAAGVPHPDDWHTGPAGSLDFLVDQPPGRYLFLRLRLTGDGTATPRVRRIRLDFPRSTSLDLLPAVYREEPRAEDFSERFLSLFDAAIEDLDRAVERFPALLDSQGTPAEALPWLARFLDVAFDPAWSEERRRELLAAIPELYRLRGTPEGLRRTLQLLFGVDAAIEELGLTLPWGALGADGAGAMVLGSHRLFGRSRARLRLGSSGLGAAPLRSFGNPAHDALTAGAFRFRVLVPGLPGTPSEAAAQQRRLERLVNSQKPAHTVAGLRVGGGELVIGGELAVGIDTLLAPPPAPVLGAAGNVRLGRGSVLRSAPGAPCPGIDLSPGISIGPAGQLRITE